MLRIPNDTDTLGQWARDLHDVCMDSAEDRSGVYTRATQYYYSGSFDSRAAIYNKVKPFIDKLAGFLMQPTDVRFQITFDSGEPETVLDRAQLVAEKLTADFRQTDTDITFAESVVWSLVNGCGILKMLPDGAGFKTAQVHPLNFGVLSETTLALDEQEAFCHVSYPTISRLNSDLIAMNHPRRREIISKVFETRASNRDEDEPNYIHQMIVGGLHPLGDHNTPPEAAGIVQVFPIPSPWRPSKKFSEWNETRRHVELWIKDQRRDGDYTVVQFVYPDIIIEGDDTRRNISKVPGKSSFIKVQSQPTPGYFWGRSTISDVQMLQDVLNKRLRDLAVIWNRNALAPYTFSGFTSITEEMYYKIINEGGFLADPNPNAKANKLTEPPPPGYMEELQFVFQMFDEAGGFSPIMSGQGEPGVRAGVHAQTLVRTSSPRLIDQAARIERQLADVGFLGLRIMQAQDGMIYTTDNGVSFLLSDLPGNMQVQVDSHSASPAFAEDNRQVAIALARAGAVDATDLIHMLHPPGSELLLARLKQREKAQAAAAQKQEMKETILSLVTGKTPARGARGRSPRPR